MNRLAERGLADVCIAAVPYGTGNDLSRVLGWGGGQPSPSLTGRLFANLRAHTRLVAKAQPTLFDIWEVTMSAAPSAEGGGFFNVRDGVEAPLDQGRTSALAESLGAGGAAGGAADGQQVHVELMMNYFSIGADAAMCFDFERNRPKGSAALNKLVYAIEGGKQQVLAYKYPPIAGEFIYYIFMPWEITDYILCESPLTSSLRQSQMSVRASSLVPAPQIMSWRREGERTSQRRSSSLR